jgi:hypothetical protein
VSNQHSPWHCKRTILRVDSTRIREDSTRMRAGSIRMRVQNLYHLTESSLERKGHLTEKLSIERRHGLQI